MKKTLLCLCIAAACAACSPTHGSYLKDQDSPVNQNANASRTASLSAINPESALTGAWTCKSGEICSFTLISISTKDGIASITSTIGDTDCEIHQDAKLAISKENGKFHLELAFSGSDATLEGKSCDTAAMSPSLPNAYDGKLIGEVSQTGTINDLELSTEHYVRKPVQNSK